MKISELLTEIKNSYALDDEIVSFRISAKTEKSTRTIYRERDVIDSLSHNSECNNSNNIPVADGYKVNPFLKDFYSKVK